MRTALVRHGEIVQTHAQYRHCCGVTAQLHGLAIELKVACGTQEVLERVKGGEAVRG